MSGLLAFNLAKICDNKSLSLTLFLSKTSSGVVSQTQPIFFAPSRAFVKLSYLSYTFMSSFFFISSTFIVSGSHKLTNLTRITPSLSLTYKSSPLGSIGNLGLQSASPLKSLLIILAYLFFSLSLYGLAFLLYLPESSTRNNPIPSLFWTFWNFSLVPASIIFFKKTIQLKMETFPFLVNSVSLIILSKSSSLILRNLNSNNFSFNAALSISPLLYNPTVLNKSSYSW